VCCPSDSDPVVVYGDVQLLNVAVSTRHSNVAPAAGTAWNVNVAVV
jgi:hypothetical protein